MSISSINIYKKKNTTVHHHLQTCWVQNIDLQQCKCKQVTIIYLHVLAVCDIKIWYRHFKDLYTHISTMGCWTFSRSFMDTSPYFAVFQLFHKPLVWNKKTHSQRVVLGWITFVLKEVCNNDLIQILSQCKFYGPNIKIIAGESKDAQKQPTNSAAHSLVFEYIFS